MAARAECGGRRRVLGRRCMAMAAVVTMSLAVMSPTAAQADVGMRLSGPAEYKSWLNKGGKLGAVIAVRITDPNAQVATVKWCLDFGGSPAQCKTRSPKSLGWQVRGGWAGDIKVKGVRLSTQSCARVDADRPRVALVVRAFDKDGVRVASARHRMIETCNVS